MVGAVLLTLVDGQLWQPLLESSSQAQRTGLNTPLHRKFHLDKRKIAALPCGTRQVETGQLQSCSALFAACDLVADLAHASNATKQTKQTCFLSVKLRILVP
jgi:hypothetical protein